jgi:1,5-anhydro-D-fructose reductase (1,5-anhydro-D-mannitol-forming)
MILIGRPATTTQEKATTMSDLKFGLIGASYVAGSRMVPAFQANGIITKALFDTDKERFQFWRDQDLELLTTDLDELLGTDIDAVYISSRNDQHASHAIAAAKAGKHVLVEKPMALTLSDARAIVAAADEAGIILAVNHHLPGSPLHATARQLVANGRIGRLHSARINHAVLLPENLREWRLADVPGGGVVFDITVHDASVLNPLFGAAPLRVTALGVSQASWNRAGTRDSVMTIMEYAAGDHGVPGLAQTHDAFTVPYPGTSMEIHGETGAIVIGDAMTQDTPGTVVLHTPDRVEPIDVDVSEDLYHINVRAFAAAVRGEGQPTATGEDGLRALHVALAVEQSLKTDRTVDLSDLQ